MLFVLRRPAEAAAVITAANKAEASIQRKWLRSDAPPDGNYKIWLVDWVYEETCCLIKLETKNDKQSTSLVDSRCPVESEQGTARGEFSITFAAHLKTQFGRDPLKTCTFEFYW